MPETPTPLDLDVIRARADATTPGPYQVDNIGGDPGVGVGILSHEIDFRLVEGGREQGFRDAEFFVHARTDVLALVAEVERLRAEVAMTARTAPAWDEEAVTDEALSRARAALAQASPSQMTPWIARLVDEVVDSTLATVWGVR